MSRTVRNLLRVCVATVSLLAVAPATATAQKDVFVDAFIALHSALPGTYGDEGPQVTKEFARLAAAFAAWNRSADAAELELKKRSASPGELRRAVSLDPGRIQARYMLARTLQRLGRDQEANEQLAAFDKLRAAMFEEQGLKFERETRAIGQMTQ